MAGATNRALKSAGIPKGTIKTLRVESGGRMSLRSAIQLASGKDLPVGKAHDHLAKRDAKHAASPEGQAAAADSRSKAALQAAMQKRQGNLTRVVDAASQMTLTRRLVRQHMAKQEAKQNAEAARPKWSPKGRQNTPDNAQRMAGMLRDGADAVRAAGTPEKGMVHVYNPDSKKTATLKALSTKGSAAVVRDRVRQETNAPAQYQVIHRGTGIGIGGYHRSRTDAAEAATGLSKSLDKTIERMKAGNVRAGDALYKYSIRKQGQLASRPSPQEARAETKRVAKEAQAAKETAFNASVRAANEKRDTRRLAVAQRLTRMYQKAKADAGDARVAAYRAQVAVKKDGLEPMRQAESKAAALGARVKHLEARAKKLRIDPSRTYRDTIDVIRPL